MFHLDQKKKKRPYQKEEQSMTDTGRKNRGYKQKAVIRLSELLNMTMSILLK